MFSIAALMQHREAQQTPQSTSLKLSLISKLAKKPFWILGALLDAIAYLAQFIALKFGSILLVQPILAFGLTVTIVLEAAVQRRKLSLRVFAFAIFSASLLGLFLIFSEIPVGVGYASVQLGAAITAVAIMSFLSIRLVYNRNNPKWRGIASGTAIGVMHGSAVFVTKMATFVIFHHGYIGLVTSWPLYSLIVIGLLDLIATQSVFQSDRLAVTLPIINAIEPVVAMTLGALILGESINSRLGPIFLIILLGAMAITAIYLSFWAGKEIDNEGPNNATTLDG